MKKLMVSLVVVLLSVTSITALAVTKKNSIYSMQEVLNVVLKSYTGEVVKIDLEYNLKTAYYEVELIENGKNIEVHIDAKTGKALKVYEDELDDDDKYIYENFLQDKALIYKTDDKISISKTVTKTNDKAATTTVTKEKAEKIALDKVGGGKVISIELDLDDNKSVYEIEIIFGDYEYEIEVDSKTGLIVSYDKDHIRD